MASREGRQRALEQMTKAELEAFHDTKWGGSWLYRDDPAKSIELLLRRTANENRNDELDQKLGLLTDAEQQLQLQREGLEAAKSSRRAAWIAAGCAALAVIIMIIALVVAS